MEMAVPTPESPPLVSVGLPVYNCEAFVGRSIRSILEQSYRNIELVISDNASTDGTAAVCSRWAADDHRVRFVQNPRNLGAAANFNRVLELARGPFFKWACGDDWCAPELVETCLGVLRARPDVVLCYSRVHVVDDENQSQWIYADELDLQSDDPRERLLQATSHARLLHVLHGVMRTDVVKRIGRMKSFYSSDLAVMTELSMWGKFVEVPEPLLFRRLHRGSAHSMDRKEQFEHLGGPADRRLLLERWPRLREQVRAVLQSPHSLGTRLRLLDLLARTAWWSRAELAREAGLMARAAFRRRPRPAGGRPEASPPARPTPERPGRMT